MPRDEILRCRRRHVRRCLLQARDHSSAARAHRNVRIFTWTAGPPEMIMTCQVSCCATCRSLSLGRSLRAQTERLREFHGAHDIHHATCNRRLGDGAYDVLTSAAASAHTLKRCGRLPRCCLLTAALRHASSKKADACGLCAAFASSAIGSVDVFSALSGPSALPRPSAETQRRPFDSGALIARIIAESAH